MHTNNLSLHSITESPFDIARTTSKMMISNVFADRNGSYLNGLTLFVAHFNAIPNLIDEIGIDCKKVIN